MKCCFLFQTYYIVILVDHLKYIPHYVILLLSFCEFSIFKRILYLGPRNGWISIKLYLFCFLLKKITRTKTEKDHYKKEKKIPALLVDSFITFETKKKPSIIWINPDTWCCGNFYHSIKLLAEIHLTLFSMYVYRKGCQLFFQCIHCMHQLARLIICLNLGLGVPLVWPLVLRSTTTGISYFVVYFYFLFVP